MIYNLYDLFLNINKQLKKDKKLEELEYLLKEYNGKDWEDYIEYNNKKYNKRVAFKNELFEIVVISWDTNQSSPIHDHASNGCLLKILKGELLEERYENIYKIKKKTILKENNISYIEGTEILHKIINNIEKSVSLHIYSPSGYIAKIYI
jgi:cysteine dioxygenase